MLVLLEKLWEVLQSADHTVVPFLFSNKRLRWGQGSGVRGQGSGVRGQGSMPV